MMSNSTNLNDPSQGSGSGNEDTNYDRRNLVLINVFRKLRASDQEGVLSFLARELSEEVGVAVQGKMEQDFRTEKFQDLYAKLTRKSQQVFIDSEVFRRYRRLSDPPSHPVEIQKQAVPSWNFSYDPIMQRVAEFSRTMTRDLHLSEPDVADEDLNEPQLKLELLKIKALDFRGVGSGGGNGGAVPNDNDNGSSG